MGSGIRVRAVTVGDSQPVGLGHRAFKTFAIYPSDCARVSRQVSQFFFFFCSFFFFERLIGLLFRGSDLLKEVKGTRSDICKD